jgi:hypothetical protein
MRRRQTSERQQLDLFRALPGDLAARDAQDLRAYPFFSLAKSKRVVPIDFRAGKIRIRVEAVPEHGMATIWEADVLIWAASQIVEARDAGLKTSRLMATTPWRSISGSLRNFPNLESFGFLLTDWHRWRAVENTLTARCHASERRPPGNASAQPGRVPDALTARAWLSDRGWASPNAPGSVVPQSFQHYRRST